MTKKGSRLAPLFLSFVCDISADRRIARSIYVIKRSPTNRRSFFSFLFGLVCQQAMLIGYASRLSAVCQPAIVSMPEA